MNQAQRGLRRALVLSCIVIGYAWLGFGQASDPKNSAIIEQIMTTALSRCYSTVNGVKRITLESPTNQEFAEVNALGQEGSCATRKIPRLATKKRLHAAFCR
jgi:cell shape-determining protein MreC